MRQMWKHLRESTEESKNREFHNCLSRFRKKMRCEKMETILYVVERIDGDYAHLKQVEHPEAESKLVARALLPEDISEGSRLIYEWLQYRLA